MAKSIKGKDIAEIVADSRGYTKKHTNFNIGDWYGFINDNLYTRIWKSWFRK